jgi:hypothetical protein
MPNEKGGEAVYRNGLAGRPDSKHSRKNNLAESAALNPTGDLTNAQFPILIRSGCRIAKGSTDARQDRTIGPIRRTTLLLLSDEN